MVCLQMALQPHAELTSRLLRGGKVLVPFALLYAVLLVSSWTPQSLELLLPGSLKVGVEQLRLGNMTLQFLPTVSTVGRLLSEPLAALSAWAHLQFISFFCARWIWLDGASPRQAAATNYCMRNTCCSCMIYRHQRACAGWQPIACSMFGGQSECYCCCDPPAGALQVL